MPFSSDNHEDHFSLTSMNAIFLWQAWRLNSSIKDRYPIPLTTMKVKFLCQIEKLNSSDKHRVYIPLPNMKLNSSDNPEDPIPLPSIKSFEGPINMPNIKIRFLWKAWKSYSFVKHKNHFPLTSIKIYKVQFLFQYMTCLMVLLICQAYHTCHTQIIHQDSSSTYWQISHRK